MMFTMQEPYYGIILSSMQWTPTNNVETMGVTRNGNVFQLLYNPNFVAKFDVPTTLELIKHEVLHLAFNHFNIWEDEFPPEDIQKVRNIAADLEVNSYLNVGVMSNIKVLLPQLFGWENEQGTREYFRRLLDFFKNQQQKQQASKNVQKPCNGGKGDSSDNQNQSQSQNSDDDEDDNQMSGGKNQQDKEENNNQNKSGGGDSSGNKQSGSGNGGRANGKNGGDGEQEEEDSIPDEMLDKYKDFDDHSNWPNGEDADTSEQMIEDMLIQAADEVEKGRGTIPGEMRGRIEEIRNRRKPKPVADWKRYVRRYLGNEFSEFIRKSKKRESRRFPDAAGNRHRRKSHIMVGIDTSGSVSMLEYIEFFGQIRTLTSVADFEVIECDAKIQHVYTFRNKPNMEVHGGGGTAFEPVIDMYLNNRKKYDALIYFTDGECHVPDNTPKETLWVISSRGDKNRRKEFMKNGASVVFIPKQI